MIPYKSRRLDRKKPVRIYRNLRGGDRERYSVMQGGKVVAHGKDIWVKDVMFTINYAARLRALDSGVKNVHAFVEGWLIPKPGFGLVSQIIYEIQVGWCGYNANESLGNRLTGNLRGAKYVHLTPNGVFYDQGTY